MRILMLFLICCLVGNTLRAQQVTGTVKDDMGSPMQAVSVLVRGTGAAAQTNDKGVFSVKAAGNATLEISMVGFTTQVIAVNNRSDIDVVLKPTDSRMDEVMVVGYQKISRKKNTAAVSSISGKELANLPAASFDQLLQGRLAGVNVQNFTGEPGATPSVQVRGNNTLSRDFDQYAVINQPLYVVDGVPQPAQENYSPGMGTGTNFIAGISPQDIESIDVLRDASAAAIYGSRAANGVIMITTKKGVNTEPRVNLSIFTGFTQRPELRKVALGTTERRQKMALLDDLLAQERINMDYIKNLPFLLSDSLNPAFNANTDWQDLFYQVGRVNSADLGLSGGGQGGMTYRFSTTYYDEEGILKATGFTRYTMRLNLISKAMQQKLTINPIIAYSRTQRARGSGSVGLSAVDMPSSLLNLSAARRNEMLGAYNENLDENLNGQFSLNLNLTYEFSKKLMFTSQSSYMMNDARRDYNRTNELTGNQGNYSSAFSSSGMNARTSNYFTYIKRFGQHNLNAIFGMDAEFNQSKDVFASGSNGVADQIQVVSGFQQRHLYGSSSYNAHGLLSAYGRFAYDFKDKYILSAVLRGDASSRFGKNNKWGFFPAASAAWLISEEDFMSNRFKNLSLLKLRATYGSSGNLPPNNYLSYDLYNVNSGGYLGSNASSYNSVAAITPNFVNGVAQPGISWEKASEWNVGLETEWFNGKFQAMVDIYNRERKQMLLDVILPVTTGYDYAKTNSVGVRNSGVELILQANPLPRSSPFTWMSRLNVSYNRNQIMSLPNGGRDIIFSNGSFDKTHILSVGKAINTFYLYQSRGIYSTIQDIPINPYTGDRFGVGTVSGGATDAYKPGDMWFYDLDNDSRINPFNDGMNPDKIPSGDPNPKYTGGWLNNFSYKNFNIGIFTTFTFDRDVLNLFESDIYDSFSSNSDLWRFSNLSLLDFSKVNMWRKPGDRAEYPMFPLNSYRYYYVRGQSFFLEKGDFVRIKSINVGYNIGQSLLKKMKLRQLYFYGVMDNVLMFQRSDRLPDAEAVDYYGQYSGGGYPIPKKFTLGVQVQF